VVGLPNLVCYCHRSLVLVLSSSLSLALLVGHSRGLGGQGGHALCLWSSAFLVRDMVAHGVVSRHTCAGLYGPGVSGKGLVFVLPLCELDI
jgi:hypothetical protein